MVSVLIALFSDVHGNLAALEAVLEAIDRLKPDETHALGDLVGRGPEPEGVVETLERRGIVSLQGNWDAWVSGGAGWDARPRRRAWVEAARRSMAPETCARLRTYPVLRRLYYGSKMVLLAHGSPRDPVELLVPEMSDARLAEAIGGAEAQVVAVGHSHRPFQRRIGSTLLINTGTVGYSFTGDPRPSFALLQLDGDPRAEIIRVDYRMSRNLRAMRGAVRRGIVSREDATAYRRALLGDEARPEAARRGDERGSDALLALLAEPIRAAHDPLEVRADARNPGAGPSRRLHPSFDAANRTALEHRWQSIWRLRAAVSLAEGILTERHARRAHAEVTDRIARLDGIRTSLLMAQALAPLARDGIAGAEAIAAALERRAARDWAREASKARARRRLERGLHLLGFTMRPRPEGPTADQAIAAGLRTWALQLARLRDRPESTELHELALELVHAGRIVGAPGLTAEAAALATAAESDRTHRHLLDLLGRGRARRRLGVDHALASGRLETAVQVTEARLDAELARAGRVLAEELAGLVDRG